MASKAVLEAYTPVGFAGSAAQLRQCFTDHKPFIALARAIWDSAKSTNDLIGHMGNLLRSMMFSEGTKTDAVAAVLACWFGRVRFLQQNDGLGWMLIGYLRDVLARLPTQLNGRIEELLPHRWTSGSP